MHEHTKLVEAASPQIDLDNAADTPRMDQMGRHLPALQNLVG
jgi:hypothetical protein